MPSFDPYRSQKVFGVSHTVGFTYGYPYLTLAGSKIRSIRLIGDSDSLSGQREADTYALIPNP
ncbi:MAG: hypothetical protein ABH878_05075 [bacterium]